MTYVCRWDHVRPAFHFGGSVREINAADESAFACRNDRVVVVVGAAMNLDLNTHFRPWTLRAYQRMDQVTTQNDSSSIGLHRGSWSSGMPHGFPCGTKQYSCGMRVSRVNKPRKGATYVNLAGRMALYPHRPVQPLD